MTKKILIVDDEIDLLDILAYNLTKEGYEVKTATSGEMAIDKISESEQEFSLLLLDVMMSGIDGFETAKRLRESGHNMPIIFLTALDTEPDLLKGFSVGGDDYISKPFSVKEVIARVKAVIARVPSCPNMLHIHNVNIDLESKTVKVGSEEVHLTKTEFSLLCLLIQNRGRIFSRDELLDKVWTDKTCVVDRTIDVHIARLRKKLLSEGNIIVNRSGYGYCIEK